MPVQSLTYQEFIRICEAYRGLPEELRASPALQHLLVQNLTGSPLATRIETLTALQMNVLRQRLIVRCRPAPKACRRRAKHRAQTSSPSWTQN
jgi:hypothetical protein